MQPLEICKFNMQSDGWKVAGSRCKHKQTLSRPRSQILSPSRQHHPPPPTAAAYSEGADGGSPFSFNSLPAIALASIFQHLDSTSGFNLSQTCCACALEFAQQRDKFAQKCCSELVPTVTRDSPKGRDPYGSKYNPVSLHVKWEEKPGPALRRIHAMSHQPVFINQLWRKAWPRSLWSDLMVDGMSEAWPVLVRWGNHEWESKLHFHVTIHVASSEFLQLPWTWLALCLLYGPAAGLTYYLNANAPSQLQKQGKQYYISLRRPAQATETQLVMYKTFRYNHSDIWSGDEDADDTCSVPDFEQCFCSEIYVKPSHMQKVAVTGDWCHTLPVYPHDLCSAHLGQGVKGQTQGDDIAIEMRHLAEAFECPDIYVYWCHNEQDALQNELSEFTPFTCEAVGQSDWKSRRQQAKKQGNMKLGKAAGRERKAVLCKASQTSWLSDDTYVK